MNTSTPTGDLESLLCVEELSDYLDEPIKTLYEWRQAGTGPCAVRFGRRLRYMICDARTWMAAPRTDTPQRNGHAPEEA